MIVAVLSEKGGTGKTTLATNLAGMRAGLDRRVLLIDADPQGSALHWIELRGAHLPRVEVLPLDGPQLARHLRTRTMQHDDVIIDVGAGVTDDLVEAMDAADCVVVPVQPTGMDVWTMALIDRHVGEALGVRQSQAPGRDADPLRACRGLQAHATGRGDAVRPCRLPAGVHRGTDGIGVRLDVRQGRRRDLRPVRRGL